MLEIKNLTIIVDSKVIIDNLNLVINKNDKLAIIGEEGNGKSTLLKVILGICSYATSKGIINTKGYRLGYLEQMINKHDLEKSVFEYLFEDELDYYSKINQLYKLLKEVDLDEIILKRQQIKTLSGGEKVKLQLLKILLNEVDILLLDEPTNDLDIKTLEWLEQFINKIDKPIIYVSHDETLLKRTANRILHLELLKKKTVAKSTIYQGNYDNYINERLHYLVKTTQIAKKEQQQFQKQKEKLTQIKNKVEHQLNTITRADPHGAQLLKKKMKTVKAQERKMEVRTHTEVPDYEESINFFFQIIPLDHNKVVYTLDVLNQIEPYQINGDSHIVIIGKNGIGKSTLLNQIYQQLKIRKDLKVGFMPQNYDELLKEQMPIDFLKITGDKDEISLIRSYMGNMNFTKEEMIRPISELSGGSKAKLLLLKLMLEQCNVIILDEPTRNISPLSNPIIRTSLKEYPGAIISVSHDRIYIDEVGNSILEMTDKGLIIK